jgi:hypothetical protein
MTCRCNDVETVPWSFFTDHVVLHAKGVPQDVAEHVVRQAAIEWARVTLSLQRDLYIDMQACVQDYRLEPPDGYTIHAVREVEVCGCCLTARTGPPCGSCDLRTNEFYFQKTCNLLVGRTVPCDTPEALLARVVVIPGQQSCEIDKWVYDTWAEDIGNGALSRLLLMKDASWYSTADAGIMLRRWKNALNRAKGAQAKSHVSGPTFMGRRRFI